MIIEYFVLIEGRWWFKGNIYVLPKIKVDDYWNEHSAIFQLHRQDVYTSMRRFLVNDGVIEHMTTYLTCSW